MKKQQLRAFIADVLAGRDENVEESILRGVPVDTRDTYTGHGETALMLALARGRSDVIERLISAGASVNARDDRRRTPLMVSSAEMAEELIRRGADVDAQDEDGRTALMYAVFEADHNKCACLIKHHADTSPIDDYGETALSNAIAYGMIGIQKMLEGVRTCK